MHIVFDPATLHQSRMGAITAVVYFDFGHDLRFPSEGWNDFVVVIAGWWMQAIEEIVAQQSAQTFRFMDGPYWIDAVPREDLLRLRCVEDRRDAGPAREVVTSIDDMRRQLFALAQRVSSACSRAGLDSADLRSLRKRLPN